MNLKRVRWKIQTNIHKKKKTIIVFDQESVVPNLLWHATCVRIIIVIDRMR